MKKFLVVLHHRTYDNTTKAYVFGKTPTHAYWRAFDRWGTAFNVTRVVANCAKDHYSVYIKTMHINTHSLGVVR